MHVAIIGLGLIGGSLALALKESGFATHISGCSRSEETIATAKKLGMIDEGFVEAELAVSTADIVVLCTPLSAYVGNLQAIAERLKPGCIVTDAGSIKQQAEKWMLDILPHALHPFVVPAHPIAGTEKSGPNAAFSSLYQNKKTIITPLAITDDDAVNVIKRMWEAAGSQVELLDARRHDFIYATVSHSIQLLCSAYGGSVLSLPQDKQRALLLEVNEPFLQFVRLCGSDALMWRDIFMINHQHIEMIIEGFIQNFKTLLEQVDYGDEEALTKRLEAAKDKRLFFQTLLTNVPQPAMGALGYPKDQVVWMDILPRLISCAVMENIAESEYDYATGAGLHGFSLPIMLESSVSAADMIAHKEALVMAAQQFIMSLTKFMGAIAQDDMRSLLHHLETSQVLYKKVNGFQD